jgi:hypothetical protein
MYIADLIGGKDALLAEAFVDPKLHPKKSPTIETALRVVNDLVKKRALLQLQNEIHIDVLDKVAMYEINNGEYADIPGEAAGARSDYESGMDDQVEAAMEKYDEYLSADWLGRNTIDTGLWESTEEDRTPIAKFAQSAAKEIWKQLTHDKTPAQILSNAGIVQDDVQAHLDTRHTPTESDMPKEQKDFDTLVGQIKAHIGGGFGTMAVYEDLETIFEDDEVLAQSAGNRLGLSKDDIVTLEMAVLMADVDDPADYVLEAVNVAKPGKKGAKKPAKKPEAETPAEEAPEAPEEGAVPPHVLTALKHCGVGDTAMAEALGVSRSTLVNYHKGKTAFKPDGDQANTVRQEIVERTNRLLAALAALDGTEAQEVM